MKIWVKATVKDGENTQRLTLKVESKGEEAELEIVFDQAQIQLAEETKPQAETKDSKPPVVVNETRAQDQEEVISQEEPAAAAEGTPLTEEVISIFETPTAEDTSLHEESAEQPEELADETPSEEEHVEPKEEAFSAQDSIASEDVPVKEGEEELIIQNHVAENIDKKAEFDNLLNVSTSFEDFILKNAEWFELGKRTSYFVEVVKAAAQAEKINWPNIEAILKNNGVEWSSYDKIWTSKQVTKKFQEINITATFMELIKKIVDYEEFLYIFGQAPAAEIDTKQPEAVVEVIQEQDEIQQPLTLEEAEVTDIPEKDAQLQAEAKTIHEDSTAEPEKKEKLEEIAEKSSDFEGFLKNIADWLELGKRTSYFVAVVMAATEVKKINWSSIEASLNSKGTKWGDNDKIWTSKQVTKKFQEMKCDLSLMKLVKKIVGYQNFDFTAGDKALEELPNKETIAEAESVPEVEESANEVHEVVEPTEVPKTTRVKLNCMPEIPGFEEALGCIDKTQPLTEKVKDVLYLMGVEDAPYDVELFIGIADAAVKSGELMYLDVQDEDVERQNKCLANILSKANVPPTMSTLARMKMTTFINDFIKKYCPDAEPVKLLHFLKDLQKVLSD